MKSLGLQEKLLKNTGKPEMVFLSTVTIGHLLIHWYTNLLSLALPFIKEDLALTDVQVGAIVTVQIGVSSGFFIVCGFLADSFRHRGALIICAGMVALGIACFVIAIAPTYGVILLGSGIAGFGTALWHPAAMRSLSLTFPERRGMALSIHGVGASIGDAIGPVIIGAVILVVNWKLALGLHLLPSLVIAFILWRGLAIMKVSERVKTDYKSYLGGMKNLFSSPQVIGVLVSNTLISMSRLSMLAFFPIYIKETLDSSAFILGVYLALLYVMGIVSQPIMGFLSDRIGRKAILVPSFASMGLMYIAVTMVSSGLMLGFVIGVLGLFFYAIMNITQTAVMDVAPEGVQASTMGVIGLTGLPFTLVSPILAGYLVTNNGIDSAFWYAGVTALIAAAVLIPIKFKKYS